MERKINQKDLAKILKVSPATVALWEVGKRNPTPQKLIEIADYFNISMDILFSADRKNKTYAVEKKEALTQDAERLLKFFHEMNEESKEIFMGEARKILRQQRLEKRGTSPVPVAR